MGRSSMSLLTSLSLSFNNLRTKKARTLLTSFAGSIGIIGIALILALSNGVSVYITCQHQHITRFVWLILDFINKLSIADCGVKLLQ